MARVAPRVHTDQPSIARLEATARELPGSRHARVHLLDGSVVEGIVEITPSIQAFYDADGREGMNALLRLEAFLDDGRSHANDIRNIWLDEIDHVVRLPNTSPPEPGRRLSPPDPNASVPEDRQSRDQSGTGAGVASNRRG